MIILTVLFIIFVILSVYVTRLSYMHGVWDGTYNPTIPPVKEALDKLAKKGWR